ncbi:transporter substrate-binding domain-containing protein [Pseudodesulfovibrio sp. JC047]|uniref:substrate-binding periplasmic protein n=1 Tax=Pseudodesulfovibrio sp. JC047 TaxID=2683199 RepID=UPI0013D45371|nr:transporter substrate-binding domain-containing protein [Pseudodesulfovibrio sp. JC047]NDV18084.1 transporter substrate-binding domain-containing protein [Pseudodesulfovibrio sp. JC047]
MFKQCLLGCVFGMLLLTVGVGRAEELRIVSLDLPPYWYWEQGEQCGLCSELGTAIAKEAGLEVVDISARLCRGLEEMKMGRADMIVLFASPEAETVGHNLGVVFQEQSVVVGLAGTHFHSLDALEGKRVAALRGARGGARISREKEMVPCSTRSFVHSLKLLIGGRVDAVYGPRLGVEYALNSHDVPRKAFSEPYEIVSVPITVYVSRHASSVLIEKVRGAVQRLIANGTVEAIRAKYAL